MCLPLVLQQGVEDLQTACTLLQTSKAMRDAALAHCSVQLEFKAGELTALVACYAAGQSLIPALPLVLCVLLLDVMQCNVCINVLCLC